jgi:flavin-dependent dehydrogenase
VQAIVDLPKDMPQNTVRVWFVPDDTPYFYWLIPDSEKQGVLGLIGESTQSTRKHLERFMEKRHFEPQSFQGARIPLYKKWIPVKRDFAGKPVYLVGDAAGQVKVTTIGGIVTGFRGALGVAEAIANGGASSELRRLRFELNVHLLLRKALHRFQQPDYSRLVDLLDAQARHSLGEHSRDDAMRVMWRLFVRQPRLLLMGLRGLLTGGFPTPTQS